MATRPIQQLAGPALVVVGAVALILVGMYVPGSPPNKPASDSAPVSPGATADPKPKTDLKADPQADQTANLLDAAARGDAVGIRLALSRGGDPNRRYDGPDSALAGMTPLMLASREGTFDAVTALIDGGAEIEDRTPAGVTALMVAAGSDGQGTVDALLNEGADVNARTDSGETALLFAARRGDAPRVRALLEAGASPDLADAAGTTPLMVAADRAELAKVMFLLDAGAQPTTPDNSGKTALSRVTGRDDATSRQIAEILLEATPG